ncbi:MAG: hypothetical protein OH319_01435 [Candidatus Parvarchaeota archaeon]|nr:hypothetical protein [Candidatus Jingweiarchaeum tengchongense]MCW1297767.1 hypothetical protein [Candidatus Jingweiarchaeum tengchongense]MCW1299777.1 hypothetical protein [Candidatus Jingweiarchaeum tengchongense]MCW1304252.1 hypothetical protein [Candidatus Jingweiarchaeum tengchongense]MCW1305280.1 hypothetical protein [Candidatus Jingweiarchaeum tengchongense]
MLNKAQMSIIDLLFLIIIFSILILMISYSYEKELSEKVADVYNNNYNQLMLISLLSYKSKILNRNFFELIGILLCTNDTFLSENLNHEINEILMRFNKENYNYILYSQSKSGLIWIYNKQAKVCLKEITLSSIDIELPCSEKTQILLGTWPNSLNVKEEC